MMNGNYRLALNIVRTAKWRSFLTMLGVIIGVASVIVTFSLGEGVKKQISNQLSSFGKDLITIQPGHVSNDNQSGGLFGINLFNGPTIALTDNDVNVVNKTPGVGASAPLSLVSGTASLNKRNFNNGIVIGTSSSLPDLINHKVQYGAFFTVGEEGRNVAVLGQRAAQAIFQENIPVGKSFSIRGQEFIVRGVFEKFNNNPLSVTNDYNNAIFIPYITAKNMSNSNPQVFQIFAKPHNTDDLVEVSDDINQQLLVQHDGQQDFSVLTHGQSIDQTSSTLTLITGMVAGVAAISLFVGGIGIMNIMLVSVTERTHEIGIRKAIGATSRQIMQQFLAEAVLLSILGSIIGVLLALAINFIIRMTTDLEPATDATVVAIAVTTAVVVGVLFGIAPAIRASRKDPIEALRYQ